MTFVTFICRLRISIDMCKRRAICKHWEARACSVRQGSSVVPSGRPPSGAEIARTANTFPGSCCGRNPRNRSGCRTFLRVNIHLIRCRITRHRLWLLDILGCWKLSIAGGSSAVCSVDCIRLWSRNRLLYVCCLSRRASECKVGLLVRLSKQLEGIETIVSSQFAKVVERGRHSVVRTVENRRSCTNLSTKFDGLGIVLP